KTQEVAVGNKSNINVTLTEETVGIEEVIAIGYGTMKKSDLAGAVASVKGDDLGSTPANTIVQTLQGRTAGVDIKSASNAPGGGIRIRIRGTNSINASSEPLYVIDGFPIDNSDIAPKGAGNNALSPSPLASLSSTEIQSVEILKDASSTAIYGSRGANGVVLITTKRGQAGKSKIDFDYSLNISSVRKKLDLCNAEELAILTNEWAVNNGRVLFYNGVSKPLPKDLGQGTDWQDAIFRTALTHNYNLSISGGTENTKYLVACSYLDQNGIIIESNFKRAGLKFNLDQIVSKKIKIGVNMNANRTVNDAVPSDGTGYQNDSPLWNALVTTPAIPIMDVNGNYVNNQDEGIEKILENPVSIAKTRKDITYTTRLLSSAFTEVEILKGLIFRANFGADISNSKRNVYIPNTAKTQALPNLGVASIGSVQSLNWLTEYTLTYKRDFSKDHRLTALAGYTAQATAIESVFSRTDNFSTNKFEFNNLGAGSDPRPSESSTIQAGLLSYIARLNYAYKDKYIFTGTMRRDGSSKFGAQNKWGIFPSAGLAW
ncbi:MAG: SusC/RagA family TonB-linked outer membrane protein, partial [Ferruginibacter sp.]